MNDRWSVDLFPMHKLIASLPNDGLQIDAMNGLSVWAGVDSTVHKRNTMLSELKNGARHQAASKARIALLLELRQRGFCIVAIFVCSKVSIPMIPTPSVVRSSNLKGLCAPITSEFPPLRQKSCLSKPRLPAIRARWKGKLFRRHVGFQTNRIAYP